MARKPNLRIQTTTLWEYPSQHYGPGVQGDAKFPGATPSFVIWNLLQRYTRPGDIILDPMCGSGTTLDVCRELDRRGVGFDLTPYRRDILRADARRLPLRNGAVDFIFLDPPYSDHIQYSGHPACIGNLNARHPAYWESMGQVIAELARVLKDRRYLGLYCCDSFSKGGGLCAIGFEMFRLLCRHFCAVDVIAVVRHNRSLKRSHWHGAALEGNYFLRGFNYLLVFRKTSGTGSPSGRGGPGGRQPRGDGPSRPPPQRQA